MSVLVNGIEMPETCAQCACLEGEWKFCQLTDKEIKTNVFDPRPDDCPLVPVPLHGELIGREWLIDIGLHLVNTAENDDIANGVKWLLRYIIEAPTIISADDPKEET